VANKILNLIFKADATDATAEMNKLKGTPGAEGGGTGIAGLGAALQATIVPASLVAGSIGSMVAVVKNNLEDWREFVFSVERMALAFGMPMEEASVIFKLMEDYDVSEDTVFAVFTKMAQEDIPLSMDGIIELKELIDGIEDPGERLSLARSLIGEQGTKQFMAILALTNEELLAYAEGASNAVIVTEEMRDMARENEQAVKDMAAAWGGFKAVLAGWAAPGVTNFLNLILAVGKSDFWEKALTFTGTTSEQTPGLISQLSIDNPYIMGYDTPSTPSSPSPRHGRRPRPETGGGNDAILSEITRLVDSLPVAIADAVERR